MPEAYQESRGSQGLSIPQGVPPVAAALLICPRASGCAEMAKRRGGYRPHKQFLKLLNEWDCRPAFEMRGDLAQLAEF